MTNKKICFERDIKSLFREKDRNAMSFAFDLWKCADVQAHADEILKRLRDGSMPCDGQWPDRDIKRFQHWVETGMLCECDGDAQEHEKSSSAKLDCSEGEASASTIIGYLPYWEVNGGKGIKDMFTGYVECMKKHNIYLDDYDNVVLNVIKIYGVIKNGYMPPGNPWKDDRPKIFRKWKDAGCPKCTP